MWMSGCCPGEVDKAFQPLYSLLSSPLFLLPLSLPQTPTHTQLWKSFSSIQLCLLHWISSRLILIQTYFSWLHSKSQDWEYTGLQFFGSYWNELFPTITLLSLPLQLQACMGYPFLLCLFIVRAQCESTVKRDVTVSYIHKENIAACNM